MDQRNRIRLARIEEELVETEQRYKEELAFEQAVGKRTLLMSRSYLKRLEVLQGRKNKLNKVVQVARERRKGYDEVLRERIAAVNSAEEDVKDALLFYVQATAAATLSPQASEKFIEDEKMYAQLIKSKKIILANKKRALDNWLDKEEKDVVVKRSLTMKSEYGKFKEQLKERIVDQDKQTLAIFEEPTAENDPWNHLKQDPKWAVKAENNATLDMLTRPTKEQKNESVD